MDYNAQYKFEQKRLKSTIDFANISLEKALTDGENTKTDIIEAKKELRESTTHSVGGLWSSDGFEDLAAISQYVNPVLNKMADLEATENKITALKKIIKSPYFARIDFLFQDEKEYEKIYIGRHSLMDDKTYEFYIYDWRSPISSVFYRFGIGDAYYDAPNGVIRGNVSLKRQYEIKEGKLEYFFDADLQIMDEFLRKLLSENTTKKMKTIVETIQKEQDIVIRDMDTELMMVQGVAGSGKTSIALHRAAYLMYQGLNDKLSADNIIIISPNTLFEQYISGVLPELGEENVVTAVLEDIFTKVLRCKKIQSKNSFLESIICGKNYGNIVKSTMNFKTSFVFKEILNRLTEDLPNSFINFKDVYYNGNCVITKEMLKDKLKSLRKDTALGIKLGQLQDFILEHIKELQKQHGNKWEYARIKKESEEYTKINVFEAYARLFEDFEYFISLAQGLDLPKDIQGIFQFTKENISSEYLLYDDASALTYLKLKIDKPQPYKNIKQVVIDEAQDYYPLHFEIFNMLFPTAKYTVLGDINQTLEKNEDLSLYNTVGEILNKKKSVLATMDKSFRCTNQILTYSSKFLEENADIKSFNREGSEPKVYTAKDKKELAEMIVSEIAVCINEGYKSIGLICKTEKNASLLYQILKDKINVQVVKKDNTTDLEGICIIPVYMSKGLEFDGVLVCDAIEDNYNTDDDKKLLYISCTRALHRLNIFCNGQKSRFL